MDEARLPLRCVLADNSARGTAADAEALRRRQLVADEVGVGAEALAQRAEEAPASVVLKEEAGAGSDYYGLVGGEDVRYDRLAVFSRWRVALLIH